MSSTSEQVRDRQTHLHLRKALGGEKPADFTAAILDQLAKDEESESPKHGPSSRPSSRRSLWALVAATLFGVVTISIAVQTHASAPDPAQDKSPEPAKPIPTLIRELQAGGAEAINAMDALEARGIEAIDPLIQAIDQSSSKKSVRDRRQARVDILRLEKILRSIKPAHSSYRTAKAALDRASKDFSATRDANRVVWTRKALAIIRYLGPPAATRIDKLQALVYRVDQYCLEDIVDTIAELTPYAPEYRFKDSQGEPLEVVDMGDWAKTYGAWIPLERYQRRRALPASKKVAQIQRELTQSGTDVFEQEWLLEQIPQLGSKAASLEPTVAKFLRGKLDQGFREMHPVIRLRAARAILAIRKSPSPFTEDACAILLEHGCRRDRLRAFENLRQLTTPSTKVVKQVATLAQNGSRETARESVVTLGIFGTAAAAAIPDLEALEKGTDAAMRALAEAALKKIRG